jgi:hypothetical protein
MKKYFYIAVLVVCLSIMAGNVNAQTANSSMPEKQQIENPGPAPVAVTAAPAKAAEPEKMIPMPNANIDTRSNEPVDPKYYAKPVRPEDAIVPTNAGGTKNEPY